MEMLPNVGSLLHPFKRTPLDVVSIRKCLTSSASASAPGITFSITTITLKWLIVTPLSIINHLHKHHSDSRTARSVLQITVQCSHYKTSHRIKQEWHIHKHKPFTWTFGGRCATLTARPKDPWNEELFRTTKDPGALSFNSWIATDHSSPTHDILLSAARVVMKWKIKSHCQNKNDRTELMQKPSSLEIFGRCQSCDVSRTNRGVCSESSTLSTSTIHTPLNITSWYNHFLRCYLHSS